ncbi:MAG: hypothetical protein M1819_006742 [Sarea resinae]|nr:MAG: hypothetical protein M1819_006742 [Sarea resinae]
MANERFPGKTLNLLSTPHRAINRVCVIGAGNVGAPVGAMIAYKTDIHVDVVDNDSERIAAWNSQFIPIYEPGLHHIVSCARDGATVSEVASSGGTQRVRKYRAKLVFSTDIEGAISAAELIFICVNTPTKSDGVGKGVAVDLSYVETVTRIIARTALDDKIVVEKSTVPCRTARLIEVLLKLNSRPGVRFDVLSNPEFLSEGNAVSDLLCPDRILIGSSLTTEGYRAAASLAEVYARWVERGRIITMNVFSSELSKLAANALLAQRISSINALSAICEATGASIDEVSVACGSDSRIGPEMLQAGLGFGGSCFRKDILSLVYLAESLHLEEIAHYWKAIVTINDGQKARFSKRILSRLHEVPGKRIAVFGFSFKKGTADTRESPAIGVVTDLILEGVQVSIYDPYVQEKQIWNELRQNGCGAEQLQHALTICTDMYEACIGAHAVVIATELDELVPQKAIDSEDLLSTGEGSLEEKQWLVLTPGLPYNPGLPKASFPKPENASWLSSQPRRSDAREKGRGQLDWARVAKHMKKPMFIFDGRGIIDSDRLKDFGFSVETIGRAISQTGSMTAFP